MANPSEVSESKVKKRGFSAAMLEREKSPNRIVDDEAVNDDNSVVAMHPDTVEELQLFRGDTVMIKHQQAVARVAVAQLCEGIGFEGIKQSALDSFSDITVRYICDLAESSRYYANLAGRSESNVFDIVKGLEDLSAPRGFMDASAFECHLTSSGALKELVDYVAIVEEIPFAQPISKFLGSKCIGSNGELQSSSELAEDVPSLKHIPNWLPEFPEPHTYMHSPMWNERRADRVDNTEHVRQRRKAESSLLRLQQRFLACNSANGSDSVEESEAMEGNLSMAPAAEKQISVPTKLVSTEPNKKHGSFVDVFAPAIDAVKCRDIDSMEVDGFERRPVIHFRLKTGKKMRSEDVDVSLRVRGKERVPVLGVDEERDEKKRRAEQILRQSMASALETKFWLVNSNFCSFSYSNT
ncbi:hypothetical protein V2J09_009534 [Rumex salicifolius]